MQRKRWLILALVAGALLIAVLSGLPLKHGMQTANRWAIETMSTHPLPGAAVFFLFSALSAMLAFASSTVLVPSAILAWGKPVTFFLLWGGWISGAIFAYGIGRVAGPLLISRRHQMKFDEYREFVSEHLQFWAVLVFCFAVPSEVPGYLLGGMHYPRVKFVLAVALVESIYAISVVVAGQELIASEFSSVLAMVGAMLGITLSAGLILRAFKKHQKRGAENRSLPP